MLSQTSRHRKVSITHFLSYVETKKKKIQTTENRRWAKGQKKWTCGERRARGGTWEAA